MGPAMRAASNPKPPGGGIDGEVDHGRAIPAGTAAGTFGSRLRAERSDLASKRQIRAGLSDGLIPRRSPARTRSDDLSPTTQHAEDVLGDLPHNAAPSTEERQGQTAERPGD